MMHSHHGQIPPTGGACGGVFVGCQPIALSRQGAIRWLREVLIKLMDECSRCDRATDHGIYCLGFRRFTGEELRRRYDWIQNARPTATSEELEHLAHRWEVSQQVIQRVPAWCEAHWPGSDACRGWDRFSNEELEQLCSEFLQEAVAIMEG